MARPTSAGTGQAVGGVAPPGVPGAVSPAAPADAGVSGHACLPLRGPPFEFVGPSRVRREGQRLSSGPNAVGTAGLPSGASQPLGGRPALARATPGGFEVGPGPADARPGLSNRPACRAGASAGYAPGTAPREQG